MPTKIQNVQQNFAAGVLSPRYSIRVDSELYNRGLSEGNNFIISSQGGIVMREGLQFVGSPANNGPFRLFQFLRGGEISDILIEVSEGVLRFWLDNELYRDSVTVLTDENTGEKLTDENSGEFLTVGVVTAANPYSEADLDSLYFTNQDKFGVLCSGRHPPLYITFRVDGSVTVEMLPLERIIEYDYNDLKSPTLSSTAAGWRISFPASWQSSGFAYHVTYNNVFGGTIYTYDPAVAATNAANIKQSLDDSAAAGGLSTVFAVTAVTGIDGAYDIAVSSADAGFSITVYPSYGYSGYVSGFSPMQMPPLTQQTETDAAEAAWSYPAYVLHNGLYYKCIDVHISGAINEPGVGAEWVLNWLEVGFNEPDGFEYQYPSGNAWSSGVLYSPLDRGFPTVCVFHQQRLWLMANKDNPTAMYGSGINEYFNFLPGPNDDQPVLFVLDSQDTPEIKWAVSSKNMLLGTSSGDWLVSAETTISPTDINAVRQNASRSKLHRPIQLDTEIIYIEQGGRKLRVTQWEDGLANAYTSTNMSALAEHLVATEGVKRIVVQHIPEVMATILRENGQPIFLTYEKSQSTLAFSEMTTDATVFDMAAYFDAGLNLDYTYFTSLRNGNWVLERMRYPCSKVCKPLTDNNIVLMDSWVVRTADSGGIIANLGHLEGKEVGVLADDAWVGFYTVSGAQITVPDPGTGSYAIGLVYLASGEPFAPAENVQGTGLGTKRRWNRLFTRLLNSSLPKVFIQRGEDRTPDTLMNSPETIREGIQDVQQNVLGWGDGAIRFEQDRPYPTHIIGFFGEYTVEDR